MAPVFGEGGNLPTRFFELDREMLKHDTVDWKVGAREGGRGTQACYFSPGGRMYVTMPAALTRMDEGPKLPTRSEQIKAAGGIKARLALCLSRATLLAPDEVSYRRLTPSTRLTARTRRRRVPFSRPALCANVLDEFVRALLPQLDLTSGGPARGLHAPPGPNGLLQGRHVPPALLPPHRSSYPACRFLSLPSAHKEL